MEKKEKIHSRKFYEEDLKPVARILRMNMLDYVIRHYGKWEEGELGKGLGIQMMREVEQLAEKKGFGEIRLWVFKENTAVKFYNGLGYRALSEDSLKGRMRMAKRFPG